MPDVPRGPARVVGRLLRLPWRCLKVLLMAFAGLGPAPPRLLPPQQTIEMRVESPRRVTSTRR